MSAAPQKKAPLAATNSSGRCHWSANIHKTFIANHMAVDSATRNEISVVRERKTATRWSAAHGQTRNVARVIHANIQDAFNEAGIQIMTPAFESQPSEPVVVPKSKWGDGSR